MLIIRKTVLSTVGLAMILSAVTVNAQGPGRGNNRPGDNRPGNGPSQPPRPPQGPDRDRDGIPDNRELTDRYTEVYFRIPNINPYAPNACLEPLANWSERERGGWDFRNRGGDYIEFNVQPNCLDFRFCQANDFEAPAEPGDCGSRTRAINGDSRSVSLVSEGSANVRLTSIETETEKVCSLVQLPDAHCKDASRRNLFTATGSSYVERVDRDGNVLSRTSRSLVRDLWGLNVYQVRPQEWQAAYPSKEVNRFTTDVSVRVLPVDFPKPYAFSASINHREGSLASFSFSSRYFAHSARLVSETESSQAFEISSKLQPIAAPIVTSVTFDPQTYVVTIQDPEMKEFSEIDARNNRALYKVAIYANWKRPFGDEKLGLIKEETIVNSNNSTSLSMNVRDAFLNHPKFKKEKFDQGGKDWEAYIEVTTTRENKYIRAEATRTVTTKATIAKKKVLKSTEFDFGKMQNYRP